MSSSGARTDELGGNSSGTSSGVDCESESEIQLKRKFNIALTEKQLDELEQAFEKSHYPYLFVRQQLVQKTGLSKYKILMWFQSKNAILKKRNSLSTSECVSSVAIPTVLPSHPHPQSLPNKASSSGQELYSPHHTSVTHQLADSAAQPPTFGWTSSSSFPVMTYPDLPVLPPVSSTMTHMASTSSIYQQTSNYQLPSIPNSVVTMMGTNSDNSTSAPDQLAWLE